MEGSPLDIDCDKLKKHLLTIPGVDECHDIHVWCLSKGKLSMSCHLVAENPEKALQEAARICRKVYKIKHSTIQVESRNSVEKHVCDHDLH